MSNINHLREVAEAQAATELPGGWFPSATTLFRETFDHATVLAMLDVIEAAMSVHEKLRTPGQVGTLDAALVLKTALAVFDSLNLKEDDV